MVYQSDSYIPRKIIWIVCIIYVFYLYHIYLLYEPTYTIYITNASIPRVFDMVVLTCSYMYFLVLYVYVIFLCPIPLHTHCEGDLLLEVQYPTSPVGSLHYPLCPVIVPDLVIRLMSPLPIRVSTHSPSHFTPTKSLLPAEEQCCAMEWPSKPCPPTHGHLHLMDPFPVWMVAYSPVTR